MNEATVTISRGCLENFLVRLRAIPEGGQRTYVGDEAYVEEARAALASPPSQGLRQALEKFAAARSVLASLRLPDIAWRVMTDAFDTASALLQEATTAQASPPAPGEGRDGWVRVTADAALLGSHPRPGRCGAMSMKNSEKIRQTLNEIRAIAVSASAGLVCPFCGDDDFDQIGLKRHLILGYCEKFEIIDEVDR